MREDELQWRLKAQQLFLVAHDEVVGVIVSRCAATGVLDHLHRLATDLFLVDGEVAVVHLVGGHAQVHLGKQALVVGVTCPAFVFFLEHQGVVPLHRVALVVVLAVLRHLVDEEQAQHLHPQRAQPFFLVQVLLDRAADHFALDGTGVHIAPGFTHPQVHLAARHFQLQVLIALSGTDLTNTDVGVQRAARLLFQVKTVLHCDGIATHHTGCVFTIHFDAGRDDAALIADRQQLDIGLVVTPLHRGCSHLNLLHQTLLVGIHSVEPVHHVVLVNVRGRIAQGAEG